MLARKITFLLTSSVLLFGTTQVAMAEDEDARRAILQLRSQLKIANQSRVELANKVKSLQDQLAQFQGQLESIKHQVKQASKPAASDEGDYQEPNPQVGDPDQQENYDAGLDLFRQGKYQEASRVLKQFAAEYSQSPLTPSALFYAGSSQYAAKDFNGAISTLQEMTQRYGNSDKAGDAMLVIAGSQLELDDMAASKATLQRVVQKYPDTPASDTANERLKMYK